jgi:hypothetical protein
MTTQAVTPSVVQPPAAPQPVANSIFDKAVCVSVGRGWPSLTKTLSKDFIAVSNADKRRLHAQKDLYDSVELKKLFNLEAALDNKLKLYCIPFPLKNGVYILPIDLYSEVENLLTQHIAARQPLIEAFCAKYDQLVADAKAALGSSFNPADYGTAESVKSEFEFSYNYLQLNVADALQKVGKDVLKREQDKMEKVWQEAGTAATQLLAAQFGGMVKHLQDRLQDTGKDGKKKIFRNTLLDPINEFIKCFNPRNLQSNQELKNLVEQAKALVTGVNAQQIRDNETLKKTLHDGFAAINDSLASFVIDEPVRGITLSDDEEETEGAVVEAAN